ncbi:hypothetical protein Tco_0953513 [Tanacetum coccineum]|uniref:Uncharacterized protein n=1 Tax=Tanacetum coccineum TaxID=301880 RepID=A0ABQ5E0H9_9ASTR
MTKRRSKEAEMTRMEKVIGSVLDCVLVIPNHLLENVKKYLKTKNQRAFVRGSWCDSDEEEDEKAKDVTCLDLMLRTPHMGFSSVHPPYGVTEETATTLV